MTLIEQAVSHADFEPPLNEPRAPEVPPPQWSRELHEAWKACRERFDQLLARVQAAGRQ